MDVTSPRIIIRHDLNMHAVFLISRKICLLAKFRQWKWWFKKGHIKILSHSFWKFDQVYLSCLCAYLMAFRLLGWCQRLRCFTVMNEWKAAQMYYKHQCSGLCSCNLDLLQSRTHYCLWKLKVCLNTIIFIWSLLKSHMCTIGIKSDSKARARLRYGHFRPGTNTYWEPLL